MAVVVGGAGTFGARLVRGILDHTSLQVVVAGRSLARAQAYADAVRDARVTAVRLDAATTDAAAVRALRAFVVVDAAGPFRPGEHRLARAAVAAGAHYVDLADGRGFVAEFAAGLDAEARAAGVVALAGTSSTPALSCAVLDHLTVGWMRVDAVDVAILPGNRAPRGLAVMRSILSWAGQPVRVFLDGRWVVRPGWGMTQRRDVPGLGRRWSALADTPDLDAVPARYRVVRRSVFRAGLELPLLHLGLLVLSLPVRVARACGIRVSLVPLTPVLLWVAGLVQAFGTDRGGMTVEAAGLDAGGQPVRRRWTLVAEAGDGPVIPTLPALAVLRMLDAGALPEPGARPCVGVLTLEQISVGFAPYRIAASVQKVQPLFARVLGEGAYAALPAAVRAVHDGEAGKALTGVGDVDGPAGLLARGIAALFRFPTAATGVPVRVTVEPAGAGEVWTRWFARRRFRSRMHPTNTAGIVEERFGPFAIVLALAADASGLDMQVVGWRLGLVPLPRALAPSAVAQERVDASGRFCFDVTIAVPVAGRLVRYRGWLAPAQPEHAGP